MSEEYIDWHAKPRRQRRAASPYPGHIASLYVFLSLLYAAEPLTLVAFCVILLLSTINSRLDGVAGEGVAVKNVAGPPGGIRPLPHERGASPQN